jgi:drug/metabolite transporter (DMT)-like permease
MIESVLKNIATTMIAQSVVQMLRSTIFVYCALMGLFFLKKKLYRHHWTSMITIIVGVVLVGIGYMTVKQDDKTYTSN